MSPRLPVVLALAVLCMLLAEVAGAAGTFLRMVNPPFIGFPPAPPLTGPVGNAFVGNVSRGLVERTNNCRQNVKLRRLAGIPPSDGIPGTGDEIICLAHMWMAFDGPRFGTLVMRGEVLGSRRDSRTFITARFDIETMLCRRISAQGDDSYYEARGTRCYEPDPLYGSVVGPLLNAPFASDPTQGFVLGEYAPRPASPLIAAEGLYFDDPVDDEDLD